MTPKKVLITGAQGFIGSKLLDVLKQEGHAAEGPELDLFSFDSIERAVRKEKWDAVVHLAALSHVPTCEADPEKAFRTNLSGTALLMEAATRHCPNSHFIFASTAQVYAAPIGQELDRKISFDENRKIAPQNIYARTKRAAELLLEEPGLRGELTVTVLRLFNHTHKTQPPSFFLPHLFASLSEASPGKVLEIPVGNLDLYRDIGSVIDLVEAMRLAVIRDPEKGACETYNVSSGTAKNLRSLAEKLAAAMGVQARFTPDPSRIRKGEPRWIAGSHEKFTRATGWTPQCESEDDLIQSFLR